MSLHEKPKSTKIEKNPEKSLFSEFTILEVFGYFLYWILIYPKCNTCAFALFHLLPYGETSDDARA